MRIRSTRAQLIFRALWALVAIAATVTTFTDHLGKITKSEIMAKCPDISQITVQRALADLIKSGEILKIGGGRYTSYTWNRERE